MKNARIEIAEKIRSRLIIVGFLKRRRGHFYLDDINKFCWAIPRVIIFPISKIRR